MKLDVSTLVFGKIQNATYVLWRSSYPREKCGPRKKETIEGNPSILRTDVRSSHHRVLVYLAQTKHPSTFCFASHSRRSSRSSFISADLSSYEVFIINACIYQ